MGLREEKKRRTRREILETAEARFRSEGYDATRVRDIAALLHLSEQTVFNYFPTKESLLDALAIGWFASLAEGAREAWARRGRQPGLEEVLAGVRVLVHAIDEDRDFMRLVFARAPLLRNAATPFEQNFAVLRGIFASLQEAGELRTDLAPQEIAEHYVALFNATVARGLADPAPDESLDERVDRALRVLFRGLRPEEAA